MTVAHANPGTPLQPARSALVERALHRDQSAPAPTLEEARREVAALAASHYENFSVLTRLVPAHLRDDFAAVYAFCRWSDDLGDETGAGPEARARSLELLAWWRGLLTNCFAHARNPSSSSSSFLEHASLEPEAQAPGPLGHAPDSPPAPTHPVFVALVPVIRAHNLSDQPFHHLIDAFEMDQRLTRYQTWDQLLHYCARSADPVGRLVLALHGIRHDDPRHAHLIAMSDATCTALQLINFWQDVRRDLVERDRVYMPEAETGISADELRQWLDRGDEPALRVRFIKAMRPLLERTRDMFDRGEPLARELGGRCGAIVWLLGAGGRAVQRRVERMGGATLWHRPTLGKAERTLLVARGALRWLAWSRTGVIGRSGGAA